MFTVKSFSFKVINNISIYTSAARKKHKLEILLAPIFIVLTNIKKETNYYHIYTFSISLFHSFGVRSKNLRNHNFLYSVSTKQITFLGNVIAKTPFFSKYFKQLHWWISLKLTLKASQNTCIGGYRFPCSMSNLLK